MGEKSDAKRRSISCPSEAPSIKINHTNIFLIDGVGALISGVCLGVILPFFQPVIGMPIKTLYFLAGGAFIFMLYSFFCFKFVKNHHVIWLRIIMAANILYGILTACLVWYFYDKMTWLGVTYFVIEILIVLGVVVFESKICGPQASFK